jgi:CheY-like chemotaxis protein
MKTPVCFLIDDDEDDREIFALALEKADGSYSCITAKNGPDALAILNADVAAIPDFIFVDLNMPLMHGKECLQHIKGNARFVNTPVIIYTTSSYNRDVEETRQLGASHFLVKPPGLSLLTKSLKRILNNEALPYYIDTTD